MRLRLSLFLACVFCFMAVTAWAGPGEEAKTALEKAVTTILNDIRSPEFANPATKESVRAKIEASVRSVFDFDEFAARTAGQRWKTFTPEQKSGFANAFADLLFTTYLNKITGYNGEKVDYTGETVNQAGNRVEVKTILAMGDGRKIPVSYRMLPKDGTWRVYDVIIENISLVKNYRSQFQNILNRSTPEQLIEQVNARTRELAAQGAANAK